MNGYAIAAFVIVLIAIAATFIKWMFDMHSDGKDKETRMWHGHIAALVMLLVAGAVLLLALGSWNTASAPPLSVVRASAETGAAELVFTDADGEVVAMFSTSRPADCAEKRADGKCPAVIRIGGSDEDFATMAAGGKSDEHPNPPAEVVIGGKMFTNAWRSPQYDDIVAHLAEIQRKFGGGVGGTVCAKNSDCPNIGVIGTGSGGMCVYYGTEYKCATAGNTASSAFICGDQISQTSLDMMSIEWGTPVTAGDRLYAFSTNLTPDGAVPLISKVSCSFGVMCDSELPALCPPVSQS